MMRPTRLLFAATAALSLLVLSAGASAQRFYDPPGRVARISDMRGDIAYSPAGDGDWYSAHRNRPLVRGDALWADRGARAELQAGSTWIRIDQETSVEFLELSDRMLQVQVSEGTVNVRIRRMHPGQRVEIDTPNLALVLDRPGNFRIDVDRRYDSTTIEARQGGGMVYGVGGRFPLRNGDVVVFYGEDVRDYEMYAYPAQDSFDRYARMRDQRIDRSPSLRYLGDDLVGYSDLDDYGRWSNHQGYGSVWFPSNTYAGWAPYQDGQWIWQEPWGWTWVDDEPWGFAPSHYGRWAWVDGNWGWIPGPRSSRPVYAPALVGFIESVAGAIGWFPLGPGDVYYPTYSVSSNYFNQVNLSNSASTSPNLGRAYSSYGRANAVPLSQGAYRNRTVPTAVTVVPKDVFTNSKPVREAVVRGDGRAARIPGEMRRNLTVRPAAASVRGSASAARVRPPRAVEDQQVFVRTAPPAPATTPSATATTAPAPAVRERPRRVRMISEQAAAADARAKGPRAAPDAPAGAAPASTTPAAAAGAKLQPLDREATPRARGGRRAQERQQQRDQQATAPAAATAVTPAAPAAAVAPAASAAPTAAPAASAAQGVEREQARQAEEARAAAQKAREERRQAMEAERKSQQEQRQAEQAEREAQQQREQAAAAERDAKQQGEAEQAQAKAEAERKQAREAERQAQVQQRESERAQLQAEQQQKEATQAAQTNPAQPATPAVKTGESPRRDCVPAERIEAMRKRGVSEERIAELKACPAEAAPPPVQ